MQYFKKMRHVKLGRFAATRKIMKEYGFPLQLVMCGKVVDGRFYLTYKSRKAYG